MSFSLKMRRHLHERIRKLACERGTSLSAVVLQYLREGLDRDAPPIVDAPPEASMGFCYEMEDESDDGG